MFTCPYEPDSAPEGSRRESDVPSVRSRERFESAAQIFSGMKNNHRTQIHFYENALSRRQESSGARVLLRYPFRRIQALASTRLTDSAGQPSRRSCTDNLTTHHGKTPRSSNQKTGESSLPASLPEQGV